MPGSDIFVSRVLTKKEIVETLGVILGVRREAIAIVKNIAEAEDMNDKGEVLCQTFLCINDSFPLRIDIYLHKELTVDEMLLTLKRFSQMLAVNVLVGDETLNPLSYWLIHPDNRMEKVIMPPSLLDEQNMEEIELEEG